MSTEPRDTDPVEVAPPTRRDHRTAVQGREVEATSAQQASEASRLVEAAEERSAWRASKERRSAVRLLIIVVSLVAVAIVGAFFIGHEVGGPDVDWEAAALIAYIGAFVGAFAVAW